MAVTSRESTAQPSHKPARMLVPNVTAEAGFLDAFRATKPERGLPSIRTHMRVLSSLENGVSEAQRAAIKSIYPAWSEQVLVHPGRGVPFRRGEDVVEFHAHGGVSWRYPAEHIPESVIGDSHAALLVKPANLHVTPKGNGMPLVITIEPAQGSVIALSHIMESNIPLSLEVGGGRANIMRFSVPEAEGVKVTAGATEAMRVIPEVGAFEIVTAFGPTVSPIATGVTNGKRINVLYANLNPAEPLHVDKVAMVNDKRPATVPREIAELLRVGPA
ncbi:MAG: hypothetical protein KGH72_05460 [Candidatus Micrarchaeota archaeon]|nr:hypothetical protein [Candidatus Micrarchaeota archaeon]